MKNECGKNVDSEKKGSDTMIRRTATLVALMVLLIAPTLVFSASYVSPINPSPTILLQGQDTSARMGDWRNKPDGSILTLWTPFQNTWVEYTANLAPGFWNIGLNAKNNSGPLPPDYTHFLVSWETSNPSSGLLEIPASDIYVNNDYFTYLVTVGGEYTVTYTWLNDRDAEDKANGYDANIQIYSAFFDNVAEVPIPPAVLLLGSGILGLGIVRRRFKKS